MSDGRLYIGRSTWSGGAGTEQAGSSAICSRSRSDRLTQAVIANRSWRVSFLILLARGNAQRGLLDGFLTLAGC